MAINTLQRCATCGSTPNLSAQLQRLAECTDGHRVEQDFILSELMEGLAHVWGDRTYSAVKFDHGDWSPERALEWLRAAHHGQSERRRMVEGERIIWDIWDEVNRGLICKVATVDGVGSQGRCRA